MEEIIPTIYGSYLQTCQYLNRPFVVQESTTLNEKFQTNHEVDLPANVIPSLGYLAIGIGGHRFTTGGDGVPLINSVMHQPTDAALYKHIPFVLRRLDNDLTALERNKYRMRVLETYDNVTYAAYYLKVFDLTNTIPQTELREINAGVITTTPFVPGVSNLNPVAPVLNSNQVIVTSGNNVAVTSKVPLVLTEWEVNEILAACTIKYGDDRYAYISEIGLVSGVDKSVMGHFASADAAYTDVIAAQICAFVSASYALKYANQGVEALLDVGAIEPLYLF